MTCCEASYLAEWRLLLSIMPWWCFCRMWFIASCNASLLQCSQGVCRHCKLGTSHSKLAGLSRPVALQPGHDILPCGIEECSTACCTPTLRRQLDCLHVSKAASSVPTSPKNPPLLRLHNSMSKTGWVCSQEAASNKTVDPPPALVLQARLLLGCRQEGTLAQSPHPTPHPFPPLKVPLLMSAEQKKPMHPPSAPSPPPPS